MNKVYQTELAQYNVWANNKVITWLQQLTTAQWNEKLVSSFDSIANTCIHIAGAEKIWQERWQLQTNPIFLSTAFTGTKDELITIWQQASAAILAFVLHSNEAQLMENFSFTRLNGEQLTLQYYKSIAHVVNHSSYHRGQLVTMLRQVGFMQLSSLDLSTFYTNK